MHTGTLNIQHIFGQERRHVVPLFQRPYVWTRDEQWEPLWRDILWVTERLRAGQTARPHFLGAIVLDQLPKPTGHVEVRQVIDGQQRLTTWADFLPTGELLLDYEEEEEANGESRIASGPSHSPFATRHSPSGGSRRRKPWRYRWPDDVRDEVLARLARKHAGGAKRARKPSAENEVADQPRLFKGLGTPMWAIISGQLRPTWRDAAPLARFELDGRRCHCWLPASL